VIVARTAVQPVAEAIRASAYPISGASDDYAPLLGLAAQARVVLLGEASHGTHEFYRERARITQRLIEEHGFTIVAVEADWPDAYRVNRWVRGTGPDTVAAEALGDFQRFPRWMWRNRDVLAFISWLRDHNDALPAGSPKVGFYGLDLYSLFASIEAVIRYLDEVDPEGAARARQRYGCFDHFSEDSQAYGYAADLGISASCEQEAVQQLLELQRRAAELSRRDGRIPEDEHFFAEQNARLVKNAEEYYRSMFRGRISSWNLRDSHMAETLAALLEHFDRRSGVDTKAVVWAHNSHLGDASATSLGDAGEWNVGQLARAEYGSRALLVGFSTYTGTVTAADDWDQPAKRKRVRPGLPGSFEALFHSLAMPDLLLPLRDERVASALRERRLERAIGVVYRPQTERVSHYFEARLPGQFDAMIHFDETTAVEPLDLTAGWHRGDLPETYPTGE
jgi:erythromycin esterase-like protein